MDSCRWVHEPNLFIFVVYSSGATLKYFSLTVTTGRFSSAERIPNGTIKCAYKDSFFVSGQKKPYMYTQGQAVLNRSFFPCQDTPAVKAPYSANVKVSDTHSPPPPQFSRLTNERATVTAPDIASEN